MYLDLSICPRCNASANKCRKLAEFGPILSVLKFSKIFNPSSNTAAPPAGGGCARTM